MSGRIGLIWDTPLMLGRFIEECGQVCEQITPNLLAAPFYRGKFSALIIPTGFANPAYSNVLPALRASSSRIRRFIENGGKLLVFGGGDIQPDVYDWLPFRLTYHHEYKQCAIDFESSHICASIMDDFDAGSAECDGYFPEYDGEVVATADGRAVLIAHSYGQGIVVATCIHEYPSRCFINEFCHAPREIFF